MRTVIDKMPGGFFIYRADGNEEIIYANEAILRIFNCDTMEEFKELTGNSFRGIVHPDDLDEVEKSIGEQITESKYDLDYVEYRIIQKGGEIRWIEDYGHFTHSELYGDVFYVFVGDATEKRKRQEEEKRREQLELRNQIDAYDKKLEMINREQLRRLELIDGLSIDYESIFHLDFNEGIFHPYQVSERIYNSFKDKKYELSVFAEFLSNYAKDWVYPEDMEFFLKAVDYEYIKEQLSGNKVYHVNYRIVKNGEIEHMQLCVVNVGNVRNGSQVVVGCRSNDDAVRHETVQNRLLEEAMIQAKSSNKAKDVLLANMSHDIRTPMNAIIGFTALAKAHLKDSEKLQGFLNKIEDSGQDLLQLLDDMLELSRLETSRDHLMEAECNLHDIMEEVEADILPKAQAKGIRFSLEANGIVHPYIYSNRDYLMQIFLRIAGNAVNYTKKGGEIGFSVVEQRASDQFAIFQFTIEDTGIGISESFITHIFEPFEREKNTTLSGVRGTGLGLSIVKNIVEMMGGTIEVSSIFGKGSRFIVTLNLKLQDKGGRQKELPLIRKEHHTEKGKILVVEDNRINLEIMTALLTDAGYVVDTAENGSVAVKMLKNSQPNEYFLVLMDIQMPVMDGHTATRKIRRLANSTLANIPIIALSANAFEEDRKKSMECGMNAHLAKPVNMKELLGLIEGIA
ncbi:response regulator [bacterium 1xD42-62]|uniref:Stage 0 sporulation protein A homolog n=2 Tax=Parablautia muri TaxID=2320879 RepID=A0A9X5BC03_9FIRM|nr:response regulator [Parablautia muri]